MREAKRRRGKKGKRGKKTDEFRGTRNADQKTARIGQNNAPLFAFFYDRGKKTGRLLPPGLKCGREKGYSKRKQKGRGDDETHLVDVASDDDGGGALRLSRAPRAALSTPRRPRRHRSPRLAVYWCSWLNVQEEKRGEKERERDRKKRGYETSPRRRRRRGNQTSSFRYFFKHLPPAASPRNSVF